jgi:ABC-2 type transport system ATP-binding protein
MNAALVTSGLGKSYGGTWALRDCELELPAGGVIALVGPNGAGKTTLLQLAAGLIRPTTGTVALFAELAPAESSRALARLGFVAQDHPLYRRFRVRDLLRMGRHLNETWDQELAERRLADHDIPLDRPAGRLSGGQQAQVALSLALAKRPRLLILDEPVASLDPLARREFLEDLMEAVAEHELSVVLSSHLVSDLERVCDYLIVLVDSRVRVTGDIDTLLETHHRLSGPRRDPDRLPADQHVIAASHTDRQTTLLIRTDGPIHDPAWTVGRLSLEDLVLAYMGQTGAKRTPRPALEALR